MKTLIKGFQTVIESYQFDSPNSFSEDFAQKRFLKKFQKPDPSLEKALKQKCWDEWLDFDKNLPKGDTYFFSLYQSNPSYWFNVRKKFKEILRPFTWNDEVDFSPGSSFTPTLGRNSVEAKLAQHPWDCTYANFEHFAKVCYANNALKKSMRHRWIRYCRAQSLDNRSVSRFLFRSVMGQTNDRRNIGFQIFKRKLELIVTFQEGSRFATVPKNNDTRRPINVEPLCNIITQKQIGNYLRKTLKKAFKLDLDKLSDIHRSRISDPRVATIDLKNASDSIGISLCKFLLPPWLFEKLQDCRSPYILVPDKSDYHFVEKISAMGNGFTFELMSIMLTVLGRELDENMSVFGDDIIISNEHAESFVAILNQVGFVVNTSKSFINSEFRESCGGNFHDEEGYIESFDFLYPETVHDCVVLFNKAKALSHYPSFKVLYEKLSRLIPQALRGAPTVVRRHNSGNDDFYTNNDYRLKMNFLSMNFSIGGKGCEVDRTLEENVQKWFDLYQKPGRLTFSKGFIPKVEVRSPSLEHLNPRYHWAKYLSYLAAGRRTKDVITGSVTWVSCLLVTVNEETYRVSDLLQELNIPGTDKKRNLR